MTRSKHAAATIAVVVLSFCISILAQAAVPSGLNYQGYLTDSDGSPVDGDVVVIFAIYVSDFGGGGPLWSDTELVTVDQGLFSVELGADIAFPPGLFETPLWLGVTVDGDDEMLPRRPLTTVGFAFQADDALSLQGQTPAAFDQTAHVADMANPHGVDAAQAGAATSTDIASLQAQLDAALATIATLQTDLAAETTARIADVDAEEATRMAADNAEQAARMAADSVQDSVISGIQANTVLAFDGVLTRPDSDTALFTGVNIQVVNGTGTTDGVPTSTGNVIVGYNIPSSFGSPICSLGAYTNEVDCESQGGTWAVSHKSGSHNVIVGDNHNYSRYAGIVAGNDNNINGDFASVLGGVENTASGSFSSVSAGSFNLASGAFSSVTGGDANTASGKYASATGGRNNLASGSWSSISGGGLDLVEYGNHAYADYSSVIGGAQYTAGDPGSGDRALGKASTVSGGLTNTSSRSYASVSGGLSNTASGLYSSVSGGSGNISSGSYSSISGGLTNTASGLYSGVSGGLTNTASSFYSSVSGGLSNTASNFYSSVSGGSNNIAGGLAATIVGGGEPLPADGSEALAAYSVNIFDIGGTGPAGGIVFHVTDGGVHGLEAAPADQSTGVDWGCYGTAIAGADGVAVGTGAQNTADIVVGCTAPGIAADIADNYSLAGYDDWFLPSREELNLMYLNLHLAGLGGFGIPGGGYWSSSEFSSSHAWVQFFIDGSQFSADKDGTVRVRAVRAF